MKRNTSLLRWTALALFIFLYAPIVAIVVFSFNAARFGTGWKGFTLEWYAALPGNQAASEVVHGKTFKCERRKPE